MEKKLNRQVFDEVFFMEKYRTFVLLPETNRVFEINYNGKPNKFYDWNDFLDSEERFAKLEKLGNWSPAWLERERHRVGIQEFMKGNVYTKHTKTDANTLARIKDLPYTIFDSSYSRKGLHKCPFHGDKNHSMSIRGKFWKCFGCNEGGSIVDFYMHLHGVSFKEAVTSLQNYL